MADGNNSLKAEMIGRINKGGAWFTTRKGNYLKITGSDAGSGMSAAAFAIADDKTVSAAAYTFGTDWFDISFHGGLIDIYVDPDTLKRREIVIEGPDSLKLISEDGAGDSTSRLAAFCRQAYMELMASSPASGLSGAYHIDGAGFAAELTPSEARMGRRKSIFKLVNTECL